MCVCVCVWGGWGWGREREREESIVREVCIDLKFTTSFGCGTCGSKSIQSWKGKINLVNLNGCSKANLYHICIHHRYYHHISQDPVYTDWPFVPSTVCTALLVKSIMVLTHEELELVTVGHNTHAQKAHGPSLVTPHKSQHGEWVCGIQTRVLLAFLPCYDLVRDILFLFTTLAAQATAQGRRERRETARQEGGKARG